MPEDDYRELIEEKFRGCYARMDSNFELIHQKLGSIEKQTTLTNNRVTKVEDNLLEYKFFQKYPKLFAIVIILVGLSTVAIVLHQTGIIG